jgi:hypothetical protein
MSDFDAVLERLLTDPSFAASLADNPDRALAGYRLDEGEADLLRSQVAGDAAAEVAAVESRTTKSSTFGLFSSLGEWSEFGSAAGIGGSVGRAVHDLGDELRDPPAVIDSGLGERPAAKGPGAGGYAASDSSERDLDGLPAVSQLGEAPRTGLGEASHGGRAEPAHPAPPKGYDNKVDADGDGTWDKATYRGRADGGVDILVDLDGDGRVDFVGHDTDRDYRVESAAFDYDADGKFDKRMYDDNGDGWLDRTVWTND